VTVVPQTAGAPPGPLSGLRVLLVEDNLTNQQVAKAILRQAGADVDVAADGAAAVAACDSAIYTLVLMDVQMPGMDGLEATRTIRASERAAARSGGHEHRHRIIGLTAAGGPDFERECRLAGMDDYLTKPVSRTTLLKALVDAAGRGAG
jgi:CheY-like chemotaxis protein